MIYSELINDYLCSYTHTDLCRLERLGLRLYILKSSVQLVLREYDFTTQPSFTEEDIFNLLPIIRVAQFKPSDGSALFELATSQVSSGNFSDAHEMTSQAMGIYSQVFGPLHSDITNCYRLMARIHFLANESVPAMCFQHKAVMVFERVLGVDHPDTVSAYVNLALYCHHCDQTQVALRVMYRAHYLISLMFGDDSPEIATCDSNIALMLHSCKEYDLSVSYLEHALKLNTKYHGDGSIQVALNHHLIARGPVIHWRLQTSTTT
ncbi:clustered mitochondria protein homolog [Dysidea avara]|uniref:clustered mitochondria protein homolog n=1 Tax=Dysidea avara TaxID=196820 RepID=UPI00332A4E6B